jgi:hypothetical protein
VDRHGKSRHHAGEFIDLIASPFGQKYASEESRHHCGLGNNLSAEIGQLDGGSTSVAWVHSSDDQTIFFKFAKKTTHGGMLEVKGECNIFNGHGRAMFGQVRNRIAGKNLGNIEWYAKAGHGQLRRWRLNSGFTQPAESLVNTVNELIG